jgi:hypothetical protein
MAQLFESVIEFGKRVLRLDKNQNERRWRIIWRLGESRLEKKSKQESPNKATKVIVLRTNQKKRSDGD